jgi:hypothetical protein
MGYFGTGKMLVAGGLPKFQVQIYWFYLICGDESVNFAERGI